MNQSKKITRAKGGGKRKPGNGKVAQSAIPAKQSADKHKSFPIVAVGASAGGLSTFEIFLRNTPQDSGMAFILIIHLDPAHKSLMAELLAPHTAMKVTEIKDGEPVMANHVYTIPPNCNLSISGGKLKLLEPAQPPALRHPIDYFFRTLAADQGSRAIAVVLSGTGSDGTLGIRAIKENGGVVAVQKPETAEYAGMPRNAASSGLADYILPLERIPGTLVRYTTGYRTNRLRANPSEDKGTIKALRNIVSLVFDHTGNDFSQYKLETIARRIERRMNLQQIEDTQQYARYLSEHPSEIEQVFKDLVIGVTNFFRDPEAFENLKTRVFPQLFEKNPSKNPLRIWVVGCSTGEEAYSLAICFKEYLSETKLKREVQIFATDIDVESVDQARRGLFPVTISADVSKERLDRFFLFREAGYEIKREIRDMIIFAPHSVFKDPPFTRLDLISCRNLLIYLTQELQDRIVSLYHFTLNPHGFLFLGTSENIGNNNSELYEVVNKKWRIFRRESLPGDSETRVDFSTNITQVPFFEGRDAGRGSRSDGQKDPLFKKTIVQFLLERFSPPCVAVNNRMEVLYVHGVTDRYLHVTSGQPEKTSILDMARPGLKPALEVAVRKSQHQQIEVFTRNVQIKMDGHIYAIDLLVKPLAPASARRSLVIFLETEIDVNAAQLGAGLEIKPGEEDRVKRLEKELEETRDDLYETITKLESANEELRLTNEELQSSNEELASSKEELQSLNEELITVNAELQSKIDQLTESNNDFKNLLDNTQVATIFLTSHLKIKKFTPESTRIVNMRESDVGRAFSDMGANIRTLDLVEEARNVLNSLVPVERHVQSKDGHWYLLRVRPYRTTSNMIDGVVLTFIDNHEQKTVETDLRNLTMALEQSPSMILITDAQGRVEFVNAKFTEQHGDIQQRLDQLNKEEKQNDRRLGKLFVELFKVAEKKISWEGEVQLLNRKGETYWAEISISPLHDKTEKPTFFAIEMDDISHRKQAEENIARLAAIVESTEDAVIGKSPDGNVAS